MKITYINFLLEKLDSAVFEQEYTFLKEELKDFWTLLEDKLDAFSQINNRDINAVAEFNKKKREGRTGAPVTPATPPTPPALSATTTITKKSPSIRPLSKESSGTLMAWRRDPKHKKQWSEIDKILASKKRSGVVGDITTTGENIIKNHPPVKPIKPYNQKNK